MKKLAILWALAFIIGCQDATEVVRIDTPLLDAQNKQIFDSQNKPIMTAQYYVVVRDPEAAFSIVAMNTTSSQSASGQANVLQKVNLSGQEQSSETQNVVQLAETMDQLNAQELGSYKAALFGLNSNPTSDENRKNFWSTITAINSTAAELRRLNEIQLTKRLEIQQDVANAAQATTAAGHGAANVLSDAAQAHVNDPSLSKQIKEAQSTMLDANATVQKAAQNPSTADPAAIDKSISDATAKFNQVLPKLSPDRQEKVKAYLTKLKANSDALKQAIQKAQDTVAAPAATHTGS